MPAIHVTGLRLKTQFILSSGPQAPAPPEIDCRPATSFERSTPPKHVTSVPFKVCVYHGGGLRCSAGPDVSAHATRLILKLLEQLCWALQRSRHTHITQMSLRVFWRTSTTLSTSRTVMSLASALAFAESYSSCARAGGKLAKPCKSPDMAFSDSRL